MFLQDGHNPPWCFCNMDISRPSQDVTDMHRCMWHWFLERYNVHVVNLGNKVFYANYVFVFIDIDKLKGKLMQNLVKI